MKTMHLPAQAMTDEELQARIVEIGPWFHNMRLRGLETAPDHFLGNYPEVKFDRFRDSLPADLAGKTVLDIGCNAGFYSLEMKRRGQIVCSGSIRTRGICGRLVLRLS